MKITLTREEKAALLLAASKGELDTNKVPRIYEEIKGCNPFLELMKELPDSD